jgi:uncharacterized protein
LRWIVQRANADGVHYLLMYEEVVPGFVEARAPHRGAHLRHAEGAVARGELLLAGALADPIDGSVFLFSGESPAAAEHFAQTDPYVVQGLVKRWRVRRWTTVVGAGAATPLRSADFLPPS